MDKKDIIISELRDQVESLRIDLDMWEDPIYCPTCGSCGESGCCNPDKCEGVKETKRLYCDTNWRSYGAMESELEAVWLRNRRLIEELEKLAYTAHGSCRVCRGIREAHYDDCPLNDPPERPETGEIHED